MRPLTVVLAPGGPGLGVATLAGVPLPAGCRRVAPDTRYPAGVDPYALQAARLVELLGGLGAADDGAVLLVAHSAGVRPAIRAAAASPVRLAGVVLLAGQLRDRTDDPDLLARNVAALDGPLRETAARSQATPAAEAPADDATLRDFLVADLAVTLPALGPAHRRFLDDCAATWDLRAVREVLAGRVPDDDLTGPAGRIAAPVLVVNGGSDPWAGAPSAHELAAAIPDARVAVVPGAGHAPWLDDPDLVGDLVAGLVDRTPERTAAR
jgi:pimeloyl-ACP methyl ester carboxylesterase